MNTTQEVFVLKGLPTTDKLKFAEQKVTVGEGRWTLVSQSKIRQMMTVGQDYAVPTSILKDVRDAALMQLLRGGYSVVVDVDGLEPKDENRLGNLVTQYASKSKCEVSIQVVQFDQILIEALDKDAQSDKPLGRKAIKRMQSKMLGLKYKRDPYYREQDNTKSSVIICDLDGTLALMNGRNPFDTARCEGDLLNLPVADIITTFQKAGTKLILLTGRQAKFRIQTENWLDKHGIEYEALYMRATDDSRKDGLVKREIVETHILSKYYVRFVLDDRDQVVDMWRLDIGLPCLQVNYGDF